MRLSNFLDCLIVLDESVVTTRDEALPAILERLASAGVVSREAVSDIHASIITREELGPTGIGEGVAIPHAWHPTIAANRRSPRRQSSGAGFREPRSHACVYRRPAPHTPGSGWRASQDGGLRRRIAEDA